MLMVQIVLANHIVNFLQKTVDFEMNQYVMMLVMMIKMGISIVKMRTVIKMLIVLLLKLPVMMD